MLRSKRPVRPTVAQRPHSEETEIGSTSVVQPARVAPSLGEVIRQLGGLERLDQTCLNRAPSDMEDEQDINRPRLTYFAAVSKSLPDLAPRPGAWQSSKVLSCSALLATELRVLPETTNKTFTSIRACNVPRTRSRGRHVGVIDGHLDTHSQQTQTSSLHTGNY